jgi:hypothetical protein
MLPQIREPPRRVGSSAISPPSRPAMGMSGYMIHIHAACPIRPIRIVPGDERCPTYIWYLGMVRLAMG